MTVIEKFAEDRLKFLIALLSPARLRATALCNLENHRDYVAAKTLSRCSIEYGEGAYLRGGVCDVDITLRCSRAVLEKLDRRIAADKGPKLERRLHEAIRASLPGGYDVSNLDVRSDASASSRTEGCEEPVAEKITRRGKLGYRPGFNDIWFGDEHYDLRARKKARLCIQYLVENGVFDALAARHFLEEIDPYVRKHGGFPRAADIKIDHYFNDRTGKLLKLRKDLIHAAGLNGRYFLKVK